jgi:hypothetical protein
MTWSVLALTLAVVGQGQADPDYGHDIRPLFAQKCAACHSALRQEAGLLLDAGGIRGGEAHGSTDELGFHAVENRHYVTDIHATLPHQMGLDARQLVVPGRKRLERDFGRPIHQIIA